MNLRPSFSQGEDILTDAIEVFTEVAKKRPNKTSIFAYATAFVEAK